MTPTSEIQTWPIERLVFYARNPRKNDAAVDRMCASIREFGFKIPVLAKSSGEVVDGHLRLKAARKLGIAQIPVITCDEWSEAQVKAFRLMVNRSVAWAEWDEELLKLEVVDLEALGYDLQLTGFDDGELDLLRESGTTGATDEDAVPEVQEAVVSAPGDLWLLGSHRVLCGDATSTADLDRLMSGERADLVFTDPPYNVDYEGYTTEHLKIQNDRMSDAAFLQFLTATFQSYRHIVKDGGSLYVCHASSCQRDFQNAIEAAGFSVRCQIIWAKNTFAWGFGRYKFQHEPIFYCHVAGQSDPWYGDKSQSTLWNEKKPAANRLHPTMKPVELIERALVNSSKTGGLVVDLFGGSGSTLMGCERRDRRAGLMELDPKYVDVIVRRWQEFASRKAVLDGDGGSFDAVAAKRQGHAPEKTPAPRSRAAKKQH